MSIKNLTMLFLTSTLAIAFLASGARAEELSPERIGNSWGALSALEISCPADTLTAKTSEYMEKVWDLYKDDEVFLQAMLKSVGDHTAEIEADPSLCAKAKDMQDTGNAGTGAAPDLFLKGGHVGTFSALRDFCGGTYTLPKRIIDDIGFNIVMFGKNAKFLKGYDEAYIATHYKVISGKDVCVQLSLDPVVKP